MRPPDELTLDDVKEYQLFLVKHRGVKWSSFNSDVCAIRFFYRNVLGVDWDIEKIPYQKCGRNLPEVLSKDEVIALLDALPNLKHRAILTTLYSGGLRVGEALRLRLRNVDSGRMMIRIEQGKGRKDRYTMLSPKLLETLRHYWLEYRPATWLFPGRDPSRPISREAVEKVVRRAREKAGIGKHISPHSLRHAFATHEAKGGTNLLALQKFLGHARFETTRSTSTSTIQTNSRWRCDPAQPKRCPSENREPEKRCRTRGLWWALLDLNQ